MKSGGGLMAPPGCFPGRYSPTYRSSDPRRCVPNPSSRILEDASLMCNSWSPRHNAWLEEAEAQAKNKRRDPDAPSVLPAGEKKRKRTSIAAPEKRSLEAYFAVQPRPSGEKITAIAEKLDLKKNVVRVWFCNQRQKQKRMKFAAQH
uniref:Abnormal chemosensory jump 6, isoform F n=1 Tax=Bombyx mori TaxID=7091 RepID=G3XFZ0_BOMMO|nr:abnormal chemosensory jump 6, isoform F [Bombyx mori]